MHNFVTMEPLQSSQHLVNNPLDLIRWYTLAPLHLELFKEITLFVIKDKEQFLFFSKYLMHFNYMDILVIFKNLNFPIHCLANVVVLVLRLLEHLYSNKITCVSILRFEYLAVSAFPYQLKNSKLLHLLIILIIK